MIKRRFALLAAVAAALLLFSGPVKADPPGETITWMYPIWPPAIMPEGPDQAKGILLPAFKMMRQALPGYAHEETVTNMKRLLKSSKSQRRVCSHLLMKTPQRMKYIAGIDQLLDDLAALGRRVDRR